MGVYTVGGLWIQISDSLYATYNNNLNASILHDDGVNKWLRLRLINGYDLNITLQGESGLLVGAVSTINRTPLERRSVQFSTPESRTAVYHILESYRNQAIVVRDYNVPDAADEGVGYSTRTFYMRSVVPVTGLISNGITNLHRGGYDITLERADLV